MMKIFHGLHTLHQHPFPRSIVTIGSFDGIHRAHQLILRRVIQRARRLHGTSVLLTFDPHPLKILQPRRPFFALTCIEHRLRLLSRFGLDACVVIPFSKSFSRLSAGDFIEKILVRKLKVKELWVGFDYVFGRNREGTIQLLKEYGKRFGFEVVRIPPVKMGGKRFSSTQIRGLIAKGKLAEAARCLGRPYSLYGKVVRGSGRGRHLGFPTANLKPYHEAIPPKGVYGVTASPSSGGKSYLGILNIGTRPTFEKKEKVVIEVHLLDFQGNLYGKKMEVTFLKRIRPERKFPTKEALMERIRRDEKMARRLLTVLPGRRGLPA